MLFLFVLNTAHYIYVKTWFCSLGALSLFLYFNQREALLPLHEKEFPRFEVIFYSQHLIGLGTIRGKRVKYI